MPETRDLIIPVYLNQRIVFDLMAVLEGGLVSVTQVSQTSTATTISTQQIGTTFGLGAALSSLLKIDFNAKQDKQKNDSNSTTKTEERIHTSVSLFVALCAALREKGHLKQLESNSVIMPGDLVEFASTLHRNPLIETLASFLEVIDMVQSFIEKPKGKGNQQPEMSQVKKQMGSLVSFLKTGETTDLTTKLLVSGHRAVIALENQSLNDPSMSDLVDGTFRVVGKVTRVIGEAEGAISLNRKSAINRLPAAVLEQFKTAIAAPELGAMALPPLEWEIKGPAIQVLPIAIFA